MKRKGLFIIGIIIIALVLSTVGCSNDQGASTGKPEFTFAMSGQYKPFNYYNEQNELTGFDVEIGNALAEKMGMEPVPIATPWQGIIAGLKSERYDAIIGSMTITDDRLKEVDFAGPYYVSGAQLFVAPGSSIKSLDDINNDVTVGVTISTVYEEKAREYTSEVKTYDSDLTALRDLATGRTDAVITDRFVGILAAEDSGIAVEATGDLLFVENIGIAVRKDSPLKAEIDKALEAILADGTYLEISERYFERDISK